LNGFRLGSMGEYTAVASAKRAVRGLLSAGDSGPEAALVIVTLGILSFAYARGGGADDILLRGRNCVRSSITSYGNTDCRARRAASGG
jgi:hypothetical protein